MEDKIKDLAQRIIVTDWSYHYSDDYGKYKKGEAEVLSLYSDAKLIEWTDLAKVQLWTAMIDGLQYRFKDGVVPDHIQEYWNVKFIRLTNGGGSNA